MILVSFPSAYFWIRVKTWLLPKIYNTVNECRARLTRLNQGYKCLNTHFVVCKHTMASNELCDAYDDDIWHDERKRRQRYDDITKKYNNNNNVDESRKKYTEHKNEMFNGTIEKCACACIHEFKNNTHMCVDNPRTLHAKGIVAFRRKVYASEKQRRPHARNLLYIKTYIDTHVAKAHFNRFSCVFILIRWKNRQFYYDLFMKMMQFEYSFALFYNISLMAFTLKQNSTFISIVSLKTKYTQKMPIEWTARRVVYMKSS